MCMCVHRCSAKGDVVRLQWMIYCFSKKTKLLQGQLRGQKISELKRQARIISTAVSIKWFHYKAQCVELVTVMKTDGKTKLKSN